MPVKRKVVKLLGPTRWCRVGNVQDGQVTRAFLRNDNEIVIDLETEEGHRLSIKLKRRSGDLFDGNWSYLWGGTTFSDSASGTLYCSSAGYLLFGKWREEGEDYYWWAELSTVEHFPDEQRPTHAAHPA
jgi:hypothetical protein